MRAVFALLVALACVPIAGCRTEACKSGTVHVEITLAAGAAAATALEVDVSVGAGAAVRTTLAHKPGAQVGAIEIQFPSGYPKGESVTIVVLPTSGTQTFPSGKTVVLLDGSCESAALTTDGSSVDGSVDEDLSAPDAKPVDMEKVPDMACVPHDGGVED